MHITQLDITSHHIISLHHITYPVIESHRIHSAAVVHEMAGNRIDLVTVALDVAHRGWARHVLHGAILYVS